MKERSVGLADRSLMPGDVVRRAIPGRETQRGYCRQVSVHASCQIAGTDRVIYGVDSRHLVPLEKFTADVAVCLDEWVGMIRHIKSKITVRFLPQKGSRSAETDRAKCGDLESICVLPDEAAEELEDAVDKRDEDCEFKRYDLDNWDNPSPWRNMGDDITTYLCNGKRC